MSMGSGGGGGVNLPPLNQQINVTVNGGGQASTMFNQLNASAASATRAATGLAGGYNMVGGNLLKTIPTWRATGDALRMTGSLMQYNLAMPLMKVGKAAIAASMEFQTAMAKITGLVGIATPEMHKMSSAVLDMASNVGKAPAELADALYYITSAGIKDTSTALNTLNVSARAASAGLGTTKAVADLSTSVMNAYSPGLYDAKIATDALVAAVREGKANAADFAPAMGKVIPVAAAFGVKFQDVAASVAALTRQGAPAGTAAIQLRQILGSLLKPTSEATAKLAEYGLSSDKLRTTIQQKGLLAGLSDLRTAFNGNAQAMTAVFGNIRPLQAVMALIGPSFAKNSQIFNELNNSAGDTEKAFKEMQKTLGFKLSQASAEGKVALIKVGDALSPIIGMLAKFGLIATKAFTFITEVPGVIKFAAALGVGAIAVTNMVRSLATFVRLKSYTTIALQGLTNGMVDQTTGMVTNIQTGKTLAATTSATTASVVGLAGATGASIAPMDMLGITLEQIANLMKILIEAVAQNTVVTAENAQVSAAFANELGVVSSGLTSVTDGVIMASQSNIGYAASLAEVIDLSAGAAAASAAVADADMGVAAANAANTAATIAGAGATALGTTANIAMHKSLIDNMRAALVARSATTGLTVANGTMGVVVQSAGVAIKDAAMSMWSMAKTVAPMMIGFAVLGFAISKITSAMHNMNKPIKSSLSSMRELKDEASNFKVAPIVLGVNVQYTYGATGETSNGPSLADKFRDTFLLPKDEKGKIKKESADVKTQMDKIASDVTKGIYSGAEGQKKALKYASGLVAQFGADPESRAGALSYFSSLFKLSPSDLSAALRDSTSNTTKYFDTLWTANTNAIATKDFSIAGMSFGDYINSLFMSGGGASTGLDQFASDLAKHPDLALPLKDSLTEAGGSALQFTGILHDVYKTTYTTAVGLYGAADATKIAEKATTDYAKAAVKAAGGTAKGATVTELLSNNASILGDNITELAASSMQYAHTTDASKVSNEQLIDTFIKHNQIVQEVKNNIDTLSNDVATLKAAFDGGLNPEVQDAAKLMDAYQEALKNVKQGQDALFGSQMSVIDAQTGLRDSIRGTMTDAKASNNVWWTGTAQADKTMKSMSGMAKSIMDVGNAVYQNTAGDATQRAAAASKAVTDAYNQAVSSLKVGGMRESDITNFFTQALGKDITIGGQHVIFDPKTITATFGQGDIVPAMDPSAKAAIAAGDVGSGIIGGIVRGAQQEKNSMSDKIVQQTLDTIADIKKALEIKSPSRLTAREIGRPLAEGIVKGFKQGLTDIAPTSQVIKDILHPSEKDFASAGKLGKKFAEATTTTTTTVPSNPSDTGGTGSGAYDPNKVTPTVVTPDPSKAAKDAQKALAATVRLHGKKIGDGVYGLVATRAKDGKTAAQLVKAGFTVMQKFAEGVNAAKSLVKNPITDLLKAITSEVTSKLSKVGSVFSAQLGLTTAKSDLKKFLVSNTPELLSATINQATRALATAKAKFGGNQGMDVTRYERSQIGDLQSQAEQARRDYNLGKISYAAMYDAQVAYSDAQAAAGEASKEVADATNSLTDAKDAETTSAIRLAQAQLNVVTAQDTLTNAYIDAVTAGGDLADTITAIGLQAGLAAPAITNMVANLTALTNKKPSELGISPSSAALLSGANTEAAQGSLTNSASANEHSRQWWRDQFVAMVNKDLGGKYKTVTEYINAGANPTAKASREARWNKYVADNHVPAKRMGGPVSPGQLTLVGENGPELIRPNSALNVTPFTALERYARTASHNSMRDGGGSDKSINVTIHNPVPERASDTISRRMKNMSTLGLFG